MKRKKLIATVTAVTMITGLMLTSTASAATEDKHARGDSEQWHHVQKSLVALGDSITYGYNLGDNNNNFVPSKSAFPFLIGQDENYQVTDLGIPGWKSSDLLNTLQGTTAQSASFRGAIAKANVITLDIGSNDLLSLATKYHLFANPTPTLTPDQMKEFSQAIQAFTQNFSSIVKEIRDMNKHVKLVVYNLYDPVPNADTPLFHMSETFLQQENNYIASVVNAPHSHLKLADAYDAFNNHQLTYVRVQQGDVHPTLLGQQVLAQLGEAALQHNKHQKNHPNNSSHMTKKQHD